MRLKTVLIIGWVVSCGICVPAQGVELLDQQFAPPMGQPDLGFNVNEGEKLVGQTFTAGVSGALTRVSADFRRFERFQTAFEFTIRATAGGAPAGAPLATEVLPYTAVPSTTTPGGTPSLDVVFDPAPLVQAGQQYAIIVQSPLVPPGAGQATGLWGGSTTPGYLPGRPVSSDDNVLWTPAPTRDLFFRTYVTIPEPAAVAPLGLALALLRRRHRTR
jgi:hypothetical protein